MANATARVKTTTASWGDDKIKRGLAAAAATYYTGCMIALDASGNAVKCADTAGIRFDGIMADGVPVEVVSGDSAGDKKVTVERPWRFTMNIAAAVATDIGSKVYALYDNEVALSGTSNSIHVGWIDAIVSSTSVEIIPLLAPFSASAVAANTMTFSGSTGANTIVMPDALADALSIVEGSNAYITFTTTNSAEQIVVKKKANFLDAVDIVLGTGLDALLRWSEADVSDPGVVLALGDTSQMLHITDKGAVATDWALTSPTDPVICLHSNTTPITDYLLIGSHDGTKADIDVVGGTTLNFKTSGTARMVLTTGQLFLGDTTNADVTVGVTLNQGANDDGILAFKSSDVTHGMTTLAETDSYGHFSKGVAAEGDLRIVGLSEAAIGLTLFGYSGADDTTDAPTTTSLAAIHVTGGFASGTGVQPVAAAGNLLNVRNSTNATTFVNEFIVKGDGELYSNQSATVGTFDEHDDAVLCADLSYALSREYEKITRYNGEILSQLGILTANGDGSPAMYSVTKMLMLSICAVGQLGRQIQTLAEHAGLSLNPNGGTLSLPNGETP